MEERRFAGSVSYERHKLLKLIKQIKKNIRANNDAKFMAGFAYCAYMVEKFIRDNPSYNFRVEEFVEDEFKRLYKKDIARLLYNNIKNDNLDEVKNAIEKWKHMTL